MSERPQKRNIVATKNYRLFGRSDENRPLNAKKHRRLEKSMAEYGFIPSFPVVCYRDAKGNLIIKDGQHRLAIAETLGLTVYYTEESIEFDVAKINCAQEKWQLKDYAQKYATNGVRSYREGMDFAEQHGLPIGTAFALLGGTTTFGNVEVAFCTGEFQVKDRKWADAVAGIFCPLVALSPAVNRKVFIEACMAVARVESFEPKRLLQNAERCREKLVAYSTRDACLDLLETIYNYGRVRLVGLKAEATMAMRDRCVIKKKVSAA
jgi:hypothetical protein